MRKHSSPECEAFLYCDVSISVSGAEMAGAPEAVKLVFGWNGGLA